MVKLDLIQGLNKIIKDYDSIQKTHLRSATYTERKVFYPVTHSAVNDPININDSSELVHFVDTMQDQRLDETIEILMSGVRR